jgi:hypothetical protein
MYKSGEVTWLGLDFTQAKLIDHIAFTNPQDIVYRFIPAWNSMVNLEPTKYDVKRYLHNYKMDIDVSFTDSFNESIDPDNLVQNNSYVLDAETVKKDAEKYKSTDLHGIGVVMYVQSYNKNVLMGVYWLTFIDLETGEVLFMDRVVGKPMGFGLRNYWAYTIYKALQSADRKMNKWMR